ncbi:hypothetical protein N9985_00420, partial [Gammaproteobacteria bacterium]|nr:hypothetical protein [Gammaproteobacteria bacterium]
VIGCIAIAALYLWSVPDSIARLSNPDMPIIVEYLVLLVLLCGVGCAVAIWFRVAWARWLLVAFMVIPLFADAVAVSTGNNGTSFVQALVGLLSHHWIYWADFVALVLLFLPPSAHWLRESKHVAT